MSPFNVDMFSIVSAPSNPSTNYSSYDIITGAGNLQLVGSVEAPIKAAPMGIWITNVVASEIVVEAVRTT